MFRCKKQKQLCMDPEHDCSKCQYHGHEEDCPYSEDAEGDKMPTFAESLKAYDETGVKRLRLCAVRSDITLSLREVGLTLDSKLDEMTYTKFELLIDRLRSAARDGGPLRDDSIRGRLESFGAITRPTAEYVRCLRKAGRDPYRLSIPDFKFRRAKKQTVTYAQVRKIIMGMETWFRSGRETDVTAALFLFFELFMDMRAGDVCRLKWGNIVITNQGAMLVYTPHKTAETSGVEVSARIDPMDFEMIRPYVKGPDDWVIPRHENRITAHLTEGKDGRGEWAGMHKFTRGKVNKLISDAGVGNEYRGQKRGHAMRKFRETVNAMRYGVAEAARIAGHDIPTAKRHYIGSEYSLVAQ